MTPIHIQWADDGQHIRKWARDPFVGSTEYAAITPPFSADQYDRDAARSFLGDVVYRTSDTGQKLVQAFRSHRLAAHHRALHSDDPRLLTMSIEAWDRVVAERDAARACTQIEPLKHSPAIEALTPGQDEWLRCDSIQDRYDLMKRCVDRAAALARPRAAVGERNSALELAAQEAYRACAETRHITLGGKTRDAILAMRLPPPELEADVLALVIAAREFWDIHNDLTTESKALDIALEPFAATVPYADDPSIVTRYYLRDLSDEVCPCDPTLEGWAKWLAEPDEDFNREAPAVDGERFAASTLVFEQDVIATRCVEGWTFDPPLEGYDFYALRFGPGAGWSCDDIAESIAVLKEMLDDQLPLAPGTTMNIAVAHNGADVTVIYHAGPPPSCTVDAASTD